MKKLFLGLLLILSGCVKEETLTGIEKVRHESLIATTWTFDSAAWAVSKASCNACHNAAPYPASYQIHPVTGGGEITGASIQGIFDAVAYEMAPANKALVTYDKEKMMQWAEGQGATWSNPTVPSNLSWSMTTQIGSASNGTSAAAAGKFFGFRVEDNARLDTSTFIINTYNDRNNLSLKCIEISETADTDPDSFSSSENPTSYVFVDGLAWNGRMREVEFSGYVCQSRWAFIGFHTREMKKGASPTASREPREYVRLQIDRDWISWRGKKIPADGVETYPWSGADPWLTATSDGLNDGGFYLNDDEWYWVEGAITDLGSTVEYYAEVWDIGGSGQGLLAQIGGTRTDNSNVYGGIFFGTYSTHSQTTKKDRFADWNVTATLKDGGQSGCKDCLSVSEP